MRRFSRLPDFITEEHENGSSVSDGCAWVLRLFFLSFFFFLVDCDESTLYVVSDKTVFFFRGLRIFVVVGGKVRE